VLPIELEHGGLRCAVDGCDHVFALGDSSARVAHPTIPDTDIVVCVPCSLLHRDEAWEDRPA